MTQELQQHGEYVYAHRESPGCEIRYGNISDAESEDVDIMDSYP